jgi:hypothetical protein
MSSYEQMFGKAPSMTAQSPHENNDHPKVDESKILHDYWTQKYQSLAGAMQWVVSIGHIDIITAVTTMSSCHSAPRIGHLEHIKRLYKYLCKFSSAAYKFV